MSALLVSCGESENPSALVPPLSDVELILVSGGEQADTIGGTLAEPLTVQALDGEGGGVPDIPIRFEVTSGAASLSAPETVTGPDGTAGTAVVLGDSAGRVLIRAEADGEGGSPLEIRTEVLAGSPARAVVESGAQQTRFPGRPLPDPVAVSVTDRAGNAIRRTGIVVTWEATAGGETAPAESVTDTWGIAETTWTLGPGLGPQRLVARIGEGEGTVVEARAVEPGPIVFTRVSVGSGPDELWVINPDGSDPTPLLRGAPWAFDAAWSPDGSMLAFAGNFDGVERADLYLVNPDGTGLRRLTRSEEHDLRPRFSPDGSRIAFTRGGVSQAAEVMVINVDGTGLEAVTDSPASADQDPDWSPDGHRLVFMRGIVGVGRELWIHDLQAGTEVQLTDLSSGVARPRWHPLEDKILFRRIPGGVWSIREDGTDLEVVDSSAHHAAWGPNGSRVAVVRLGDIWVMDLVTGEEVLVSDHPGGEYGVAWRR